MENTIYVGVSGQISLMRRLEAIAQNIANVNTTGFRAESLKFEQMVSPRAQTNGEKASFVTAGKSYISTELGSISQTGNPLDVALKGENVWLGIQTPHGVVYSRDGRMTMTPEGDLVTGRGYSYLDISGGPIQLDPKGGAPVITRQGQIYQNGRQVASLGLYAFPEKSNLRHVDGGSAVLADKAAQPIDDMKDVGVLQGYTESSNVNAVVEMTRLIEVTRAFERVEAMLRTQEEQNSQAIRTLGAKSA